MYVCVSVCGSICPAFARGPRVEREARKERQEVKTRDTQKHSAFLAILLIQRSG